MSRVMFLGHPVDSITMPEAIAAIEDFVRLGTTHLVIALNVPKLWKMQQDIRLRRIVETADLILPEKVVVMASHLLGTPLRAYIGNDRLTQALLSVAADRGYRVYCLGTSPFILGRLLTSVRSDLPALNMVGCHHGFFDDHSASDIAEQVRLSRPDVLLVGMGTPKQEYWMDSYGRELGVPVMIGVGGTLDMLAGVKREPPGWIRAVGFEWLYRVMEDPAGKWRRYSSAAPWFFWAVLAKGIPARWSQNGGTVPKERRQ